MAVKGNLDPSFLTGLFQIFCDEEKTGIFKAGFDNTRIKIFIQKGTIVYASSFDKTHRLCDFLIQRSLLMPDSVQKVEAEVERSAKSVGRVLLDLGYLSQEQLAENIKVLAQDLLLQLFRQTSGEFEYEDVQLEPDKLLLVPINIRQAILETYRMLDELKAFEKRLPSPNMVFVLCEKMRHKTPFEVDATQWRILSLVHAQRPIEAIIKESCYNIHTVYRILIDFLDEKMIKPLPGWENNPGKVEPVAKESVLGKDRKSEDKPKEKGLFGFLRRKT